MPGWYHGDERAAPTRPSSPRPCSRGSRPTGARVAYPREVALLALNAVAPRLVDAAAPAPARAVGRPAR